MEWRRRGPMNITERLFNRLMVGVVVLGFLTLMVVGGTAGWVVWRNQDFTGWVNHTYQVEQQLSALRLTMERVETARRGYLLDQDPAFFQTYQDSVIQLPVLLDRVGGLTADNPREQKRVAEARPLVMQMTGLLNDSIGMVRAGQGAKAQEQFKADQSVEVVRALRRLTQEMVDEETGLLQIRNQAQQANGRLLFIVLSVAGVGLVFVAISSLWVILRYTRDLNASRRALNALNQNLEAAVQERTADFQRANEEIQRFAYIVSHDLRSPLVNVMGFTAELDAAAKPLADLVARVEQSAPQLMTDEAREAANVDLPEAVGFIRSSTQKMDRLINAILRLSREGRRVISPERLDMYALLNNVADAVRHQAGAKGAQIDIKGPLPDLVSDRVAIEQVFSNLVENAVKYAAKDRPGRITVRGSVSGDHVVYEVQDNGRGIDPKDHDRVFDLFRRSGAQDQPGEGIGLAHVRALAHRLGGLITLESALDQGATFRLSLPKVLNLERGTSL
jgi:signal transduction histidine kinase